MIRVEEHIILSGLGIKPRPRELAHDSKPEAEGAGSSDLSSLARKSTRDNRTYPNYTSEEPELDLWVRDGGGGKGDQLTRLVGFLSGPKPLRRVKSVRLSLQPRVEEKRRRRRRRGRRYRYNRRSLSALSCRTVECPHHCSLPI